MAPKRKTLISILALVALISAACSSDEDSSPNEPPAPTLTTVADDRGSASEIAFDKTYEAFGNPDAATVIVYAQGGPAPVLDVQEAESLLSGLDLDNTYVVVPHQAQTLDPMRFTDEEVGFEEARQAAETTTELIAQVVKTFVDQGRNVHVVGVSFGAFVVQDLLVVQGSIANGYLIQVGRLDMPAEVWKPFSEGRFVGFVDGIEVEEFDADDAGMGGDGTYTDANMARVAASFGHHRYTELLQDIDLEGVVYAYGLVDEQVGRLSDDELAFLASKDVTVLTFDGGHGETIDGTIADGLGLLDVSIANQSQPAGSEEADGYLPADEVEGYVAAYQAALSQSAVTINGIEYPMSYAGAQESISIQIEGGLVELELEGDSVSALTVYWEGREWMAQEEPEYAAIFEELGGEGDMLDMTFNAVASDDPTEEIAIRVVLNVNLIGMGDSVVEVADHFVTIRGTLGTSTFVQLSDVMRNNPEVDTLVMLNVHGSENDEINVHTARLVRDAGWTTWVPANGDISSGGVDMFVAGVNRIVEPGGFVGVHSWGGSPGEPTGRDYPQDDPVHRSQLEYFTEMMGDSLGPDFYFYTLQASPFDQVHRMSPTEMDQYQLTTGTPQEELPPEIIGAPAGYLQIADGVYFKLTLETCSISNGDINGEFLSDEVGQITLTSSGSEGVLSIPALKDFDAADHVITQLETTDDQIAGDVSLDLEEIFGLDTSNARFELPCA